MLTQDAYGRGPVRRAITSLRGRVRLGNSGGPVVDGDGRVLATIFAASVSDGGRPRASAVPNSVVADALRRGRAVRSTPAPASAERPSRRDPLEMSLRCSPPSPLLATSVLAVTLLGGRRRRTPAAEAAEPVPDSRSRRALPLPDLR